MQSTLGEFRETETGQAFTQAERQAAEGRAERDHDPGEARLDGRLPGRRALRARRLGRHAAHDQEGGDRRGHQADEDLRDRRGVPRRTSAQDVHVLYLENEAITCNGANVLAFDAGIEWDIKRAEGFSSALSGGLYNMSLHGHRLGVDPLGRPAGPADDRRDADLRRPPGRDHLVGQPADDGQVRRQPEVVHRQGLRRVGADGLRRPGLGADSAERGLGHGDRARQRRGRRAARELGGDSAPLLYFSL